MREFHATQRMVEHKRMWRAAWIRKHSPKASHKNGEDKNTSNQMYGTDGLPADALTLGLSYSEDFSDKDQGEEWLKYDIDSESDSDTDESDDGDASGDYLYASTEVAETATL